VTPSAATAAGRTCESGSSVAGVMAATSARACSVIVSLVVQAAESLWNIDTLSRVQWESIAKQGMAPSLRSSFSMVQHRNRAFLFGGAADEEAKKGEAIVSNFFNDLYQLNLKQGRWFPVAMRLPKDAKAEGARRHCRCWHTAWRTGSLYQCGCWCRGAWLSVHLIQAQCQNTVAAGAPMILTAFYCIAEAMSDITQRVGALTTDGAAAARAAAATRIQATYRGHVVRQAFKVYKMGGAISEVLYSPAAYGVDLSSRGAPRPRARINASAAVVRNTLWLFGGCVEIGDKEVRLHITVLSIHWDLYSAVMHIACRGCLHGGSRLRVRAVMRTAHLGAV
jgi:Galactose oxidase, central domain/IQ calmodulin-binding motif